MKIKFLLATLILLSSEYTAQVELVWEQSYDFGFRTEQLTHSCIDSENNIIVIGKSYEQNFESSAVIVKYSPAGEQLWLKHYAYGYQTDPIGIYTDNYLNVYVGLVGSSEETNWKSKFRLLKYDKNGQQLFETEHELMHTFWYGEEDLLGNSTKMFWNNYGQLVLGKAFRGIAWMVKLDQNGVKIHQNIDTLLSDPLYPYYESELEFFDQSSGNIYTGIKRHDYVSSYIQKFCIVKQNSSGEVSWDKTIYDFGTDDYYSFIRSLTCDNGGQPAFALHISRSTFQDGDTLDTPHLIKTDNDGEPLWDVKFSPEPGIEFSTNMQATCKDAGGNILLTGDFNGFFILQKYSQAGELLWSVTDTSLMQGTHIIADGNSPVVAISDFHGTVYIRRYDWQGNQVSEFKIEGISEYFPAETVNIELDSSRDLIFSGWKRIGASYDFYVAKLHDLAVSVKDKIFVTDYKLSQNFPNPFNPETKISFSLPANSHVKLTVFDVPGNELEILSEGEFSAGEHMVTFDASRFSSGVYFYRLETEGFSIAKKMVLLK